ncbi:hypothetical protein [Lentibacillus sp. CBA3610]|uniref:hypothetical protein n=1 Tax=Lentibacillus sp. CBA3610 TaxID=2518176 RepID=UPI0015950E2B|nr:hypothetical protein [Lentibacillus sp. CBA3610]QKY70055.1 hypothetical protein Len3610_11050 [Lentibacillus sp. CBA3610]
MGWLFWKKDKESDQLSEDINQLKTQTAATEEKIAEMDKQLQKMTRLQYKSGKRRKTNWISDNGY